MRIAYYICTLNIGGAENLVLNYLRELKQRDNDVFLVENYYTPSFLSDEFAKNGIVVLDLSFWKGKNLIKRLFRKVDLVLFGKNRFNRIIKKYKFDVIHFNSYSPLIAKINFPHTQIAYSIHSSIERHRAMVGAEGQRIIKKFAISGGVFFGTSQQSFKEIKQEYNPKQIEYVPNGIDFKKIQATKYSREFLNSIGISPDSFVVGHVGRFNKVKNHEKIIRVFNKIKSINHSAVLLLIGSDEDNRKKTIQEMVESEGLSKSVFFLDARNDARSIMNCFDVFLFPSFSECMPLAIIEAQVLGIKCVVSDALPNDVVCNRNCIIVNLDSSDDVWAQICLSNDYVNNNPRSLEFFDINKVIDSVEDIYMRMADNSNEN